MFGMVIIFDLDDILGFVSALDLDDLRAGSLAMSSQYLPVSPVSLAPAGTSMYSPSFSAAGVTGALLLEADLVGLLPSAAVFSFCRRF